MNDIQLSDHFKLSEFVNSQTAKRLGIDNAPSQQVIINLSRLCQEILEPFRQHFNVPTTIGSDYRCKALNSAVGGVKNPNHLTGCAADILLPNNATGREWFRYLMDNFRFDELIWECSCESRGKSSLLELSRGDAELRRSQTADRKHFWIHVSYIEGQNKNHVVSYLLKPQAKSR